MILLEIGKGKLGMKKYNCPHGIQSFNYKSSKDTKSSQGTNDKLRKVLTNITTCS